MRFFALLFALPLASTLDVLPSWARGGEFRKLFPALLAPEAPSSAQKLTVPLDHFNSSDTRTMQIRYWVDTTCLKSGGPVFVHMGGEASAGPVGCGSRERAHGALVLAVEHRFYGESAPSDGLTDSNMPFLSVEQNLADTLAAVDAVQKAFDKANGPVFAFGGSYSGATCAWFRISYPKRVSGCISSSGVVNPILDFVGFDEQITQAVAHPKSDCAERLEQAYQALDRAFDAGKADAIKRQFNAPELVGTPQGDVDFMYAVADGPAMLDQYGNKAGLCSSLASLPQDASDEDRIDNPNKLIQHWYGSDFVAGCFYNTECVKSQRISGSGVGSRQWRWQKCSQLAYLQAAPATHAARSKRLTLPALLSQCEAMFWQGVRPDTTSIIEKFGGANPKGTNIFFLDYSDDPWQRASVNRTLSPDLPYCMTTCDGCGHCGAGVPSTLTKCSDEADAKLAQWLQGSQLV